MALYCYFKTVDVLPASGGSLSASVSPATIKDADYGHSESIDPVTNFPLARQLFTNNSGPRYLCKYGSLSPSPQHKKTLGNVERHRTKGRGQLSFGLTRKKKLRISKLKPFWHFRENLHLRKFPAIQYYAVDAYVGKLCYATGSHPVWPRPRHDSIHLQLYSPVLFILDGTITLTAM